MSSQVDRKRRYEMKALYQMSIHAPEVAEGDVSDGVHGVEGDDVIEVGVLLVIAFGARLDGC